MKLVFITEARYVRVADGNVYSLESSFSYPLYQRYMNYFDEIIIVARVKSGMLSEVNAANCVTKGNVTVIDLPYYVGFNGYLKNRRSLKHKIQTYLSQAIKSDMAVVCRVPGRVGTAAISYLKTASIPYGIEVVGDPYDVLSKGATHHPLRPMLRMLSYYSLKRLCKKAPAALYVTRYKLQRRYPCPSFNIGVSDVIMPVEAFVEKCREGIKKSPVELICVGTLEQAYKAPDVVIEALKIMSERGIDYHFTWVGDGVLRQKMIDLCISYGIDKQCDFVGKLSSGGAVREKLDQADIFMMPSRMEGLPRALVEAMARALPCVATNVCGIPELLDPDMLIPVNDPEALVQKVKVLIDKPEVARRQSERNLKEAMNYCEEVLGPQRKRFYDYVKELYH